MMVINFYEGLSSTIMGRPNSLQHAASINLSTLAVKRQLGVRPQKLHVDNSISYRQQFIQQHKAGWFQGSC